MQKKLPGYLLLSFISFCFFTGLFHTIASVQASTVQNVILNPVAQEPTVEVPTPTLYQKQTITEQTTPVTQTTILQPTPTLYIQPPVATEAPTAIPTQEPTATPTPVIPQATATPVPQPTLAVVTNLEALFSQYSAQYNVDENLLKKIANCESGFNTNSNTGTYAGMYQFLASTWASVRGVMGLDPNPDLRMNPEEAIKTAAYMLSHGEQNAWPNCH